MKNSVRIFLFSTLLCLGAADLSFREIIRALPFDFSCNAETDCAESEAGTFVPDPFDCHNFYLCISSGGEVIPSDVSVPCPEGEFFNATTSSCETESKTCTNDCRSSCASTCTSDFEIAGVPGDCTKYQVCLIGGDKVLVSCPDEFPYFDGANCTSNAATCCDFCTPFCDEIGVEIADPYDCRMFYLCFETGIPNENSHFSCPEGEIFDANMMSCVVGATCTAFCPSSPTTISTGVTSVMTTSQPITSKITTPELTTFHPTSTESTTSEATTLMLTTPTVQSSTTTTTTTTASTNDPTTTVVGYYCMDTYHCTYDGNFPRCNYCDQSYFHCHHGHAEIRYCHWFERFNTNPKFPCCIADYNCPYPN